MERLQHKVWPAEVPYDLPLPQVTLDDVLRRTVAKKSDKTALVFYGAEMTYAALDAEVDRIAGFLQTTCKVAKGDRVGLYLQNSPQFVAGFYGIIRAGGVVVPINAMNLTEEARYIVDNADIRTVIAGQDLVSRLQPLLTEGVLDQVIVACYADKLPSPLPSCLPPELTTTKQELSTGCLAWNEMLEASLSPANIALHPEDLAILPYTSGSTGRGKGCKHTHISALHAVTSMHQWFGMSEHDVFLAVAPMFHVVGMQAGMNLAILGVGRW